MVTAELSLTEWVVLALVRETPSHGFALARELKAESDLGRILTVHRPLVYRALDRLIAAGLVERRGTEPGDAGPNRTVVSVTRRGNAKVRDWLVTPVHHVRELRIEFLIKLRLTERGGLDPSALVGAQQDVLSATLGSLAETEVDEPDTHADAVDLWRRHNAIAAQAFLDELS